MPLCVKTDPHRYTSASPIRRCDMHGEHLKQTMCAKNIHNAPITEERLIYTRKL